MKNILIAIFLIVSSPLIFADDTAPAGFERPAGKVECHEAKMFCKYVTQNITAKTLEARIRQVLKPGDVILPTEGFISVQSTQVLTYWFHNEELKLRFEALLPLLDVMEESIPFHLVKVTTDIYNLSNEGLTHVEGTLTHAETDITDIATFIMTGASGGVLDLSVAVGSMLLSGVLGLNKTRKESSRMTTVMQLVPNLAGLSYERNTNIYVSPTAGIVKDEKAGLKIGGTVSINAQDPELVLVKDFNFRYGIHKPATEEERNDLVDVLAVQNPYLYLQKGISTMIVSSHVRGADNGGNTGLLTFGRDRGKMFEKLMVIVRAESIKFEDFVAEMKKKSEMRLHKVFTEEQVNAFPSDDVEMETILKSLTPYATQTFNGDKMIGFKLDHKLARRNNFNKFVEIKVTGGGLDDKANRQLQHLMLGGYLLPDLDPGYMDKHKVKLTVRLRRVGERSWTKHKLIYDPELNQFIK